MKVLKKGFVILKDSMGDDLAIINAAKASMGNSDLSLTGKNLKLLKYLYDNKHTSPFEMVEFKFQVKAPLFVMRQWQRHRTWSYNEISRRYTGDDIEFYFPPTLRRQSKNNRQASVAETPERSAAYCLEMVTTAMSAVDLYGRMVAGGVAREQARMVLPQSMMVEMVAKVDLHNLLHFLRLRLDSGAQWEMRQYAEAILSLIEPIVPETIKLFKSEVK